MAPRKEAAHPFDFGKVGRQTGITLPDTGIRDEDGFEPVEGLFSTGKSTVAGSIRRANGSNATLDSDDMDEGESTIPDPKDVLDARGRMVLPPPRGKSPAKTTLNTPARRNPSLGPVSSPIRGSIIEPTSVPVKTNVRRMLVFSAGEDSLAPTSASATKNRGSSVKTKAGIGKLGKAPVIAPIQRSFRSASVEEDDDDLPDQVQGEDTAVEAHEDSYQINGFDDENLPLETEEEAVEEEQVIEPVSKDNTAKLKPKPRGRPKADTATVAVGAGAPYVKKPRGRPPRREMPPLEEQPELLEPPRKKRKSGDSGLEAASSKESAASKAKRAPKKSGLATIEQTDSPQVQRGPPLPRSKGLAIHRRETPMVGDAMRKTRSGRSSFKPVAYWKNERVEYSDIEVEDTGGKFLARGVKEVLRVDDPPVKRPQKWKAKSKPAKGRLTEVDEVEDFAEPWESEPGKIYGDVVVWDPEDPAGGHGQEIDDEIALSSAAINTRPVADASFRFAKTLTLPFFGSGVVDLPPGSIKRLKNARKMQMAFFVFTGRVKATVNGNEFRISKGGMFQVPRGNMYSIENDYDHDARIFFSQGCEVVIQEDPNESTG